MNARLVGGVAVLLLTACSSTDGTNDGGQQSTCVVPTGAGTQHSSDITADTTWTAAGSPHHVTYTPTVKAGATLTIEPCAVVQIDPGYGFDVEGRVVAQGTATQPIVITATDPTQPFGFFEVRSGFVDLAYVTLSHGGAVGANSDAMLDIWGDSTATRTQNGRLRHVTLTGSVQYGLTLERGATLTDDSSDVVISGSKFMPVEVRGAALAHGIPSGTYTGNGSDEILVIASNVMGEDTTWHDRGIPYRIGDTKGNGHDFRVGGSGATATWTLEAGVTIHASPATRILVQANGSTSLGSIVAHGTSAKPVVFTAADSSTTPGVWQGIQFDGVPMASTVLDTVQIRYAGGPSGANSFHCRPGSAGGYSASEDSALAIYGQPASAILTNSLIADSAGAGVDLAYNGSPVDFLPTNTFTNVTCRVTLPRASDGSCPNPVPACQ